MLLQISGGPGRNSVTHVLFPSAEAGTEWGQDGSRDGKAIWEDFLEEEGGREVRSLYLGQGKARLRLGMAVPGPGEKGSLGCEGLSAWRPHCAVCCSEEEAEM